MRIWETRTYSGLQKSRNLYESYLVNLVVFRYSIHDFIFLCTNTLRSRLEKISIYLYFVQKFCGLGMLSTLSKSINIKIANRIWFLMSLYKTKYQLDKTSIKNLTRESSGYAQIPLQEWSIHSSYYLECCQLTFSWISLWEFAPSQKMPSFMAMLLLQGLSITTYWSLLWLTMPSFFASRHNNSESLSQLHSSPWNKLIDLLWMHCN